MKRISKILLILITSFIMIIPVEAKDVNHFKASADESVSVKENVNGSMALAGEKVLLKGNVKGASFMAGYDVTLNGTSEYVALAGEKVSINGTVTRDTVIAASEVEISEEADLQRDVIILAGNVKVSGNIGRNVSIYADTIKFKNAQINGNVKIKGSEIKVNQNTIINGNLTYPSDSAITISDNSVKGKITKTESVIEEESYLDVVMSNVLSLITSIFVFAVISLLLPKAFNKIQTEYEKVDFNKGLEIFIEGLVFLIVVPIIVMFLLVTTIGLPIALILLVLYIIAIYLSKIFASYLLGYKLWQKYSTKDINILVLGMIGLIIIFVLELIPVVNSLVSIITLLIGLGMIYDLIKTSR